MSTPRRIHRERAKGWKVPPNTVYVGTPSKWCNPFTVNEAGNRETAVGMYRSALKVMGATVGFDGLRSELRGKNLACSCPLDKPCHADVLLEIANEQR